MRRSLTKARAAYKRYYDQRVVVHNKDSVPGDFVFIRQQRPGNKLSDVAEGPYLIISMTDNTFLILKDDDEVNVNSDPYGSLPIWEQGNIACTLR